MPQGWPGDVHGRAVREALAVPEEEGEEALSRSSKDIAAELAETEARAADLRDALAGAIMREHDLQESVTVVEWDGGMRGLFRELERPLRTCDPKPTIIVSPLRADESVGKLRRPVTGDHWEVVGQGLFYERQT